MKFLHTCKLKKKKIESFKKSCDEGDMNSIGELIDSLKKGEKTIFEDKDVSIYLLKAIEADNSDAMYLYGNMLYNGEGMPINKEESARYYKISADKGNIEGMFLYANLLYKGDGIQKNVEESINYYTSCAENGKDEANLMLAKIYYEKHLKNEDELDYINKSRAEHYCKISADNGNNEAMYLYAVLLYENDDIFDDIEGNKYLVSSAKEGNADANLLLGKRFQNSKDPEIRWRVAQYSKIAADKGKTEAMFLYANFGNEGDGIEEDKIYFKKSIDSGNTEAMIKYGDIVADEKYPPEKEELPYLKASADNGNDKALLKYAKYMFRKINECDNKEEIVNYVKLAVDKTDDVEMICTYAKILHD